jgi:hypothetical protein
MTEYLFVDGEYLQERLDALARRYFEGIRLDIDYRRLFSGFEKIMRRTASDVAPCRFRKRGPVLSQ